MEMGQWVMGHGSNRSPFLDGSHGSCAVACIFLFLVDINKLLTHTISHHIWGLNFDLRFFALKTTSYSVTKAYVSLSHACIIRDPTIVSDNSIAATSRPIIMHSAWTVLSCIMFKLSVGPNCTRKLCCRKDDRAMRPIGYMDALNFRDSLTTPTATIPNIFHGLLFQSTLWMFRQNLKSVALPVPEIT